MTHTKRRRASLSLRGGFSLAPLAQELGTELPKALAEPDFVEEGRLEIDLGKPFPDAETTATSLGWGSLSGSVREAWPKKICKVLEAEARRYRRERNCAAIAALVGLFLAAGIVGLLLGGLTHSGSGWLHLQDPYANFQTIDSLLGSDPTLDGIGVFSFLLLVVLIAAVVILRRRVRV